MRWAGFAIGCMGKKVEEACVGAASSILLMQSYNIFRVNPNRDFLF